MEVDRSAVKDTAMRLFNDEVVSQCFSHMPGRCLRGRWLSFDGVESIVLGGIQCSGAACTEILGGDMERRTSQPSEDLFTEADDAWTTLYATSRRNSALLATSNMFLATGVSHVVKARVQKDNTLLGKGREITKSKR